MELFKYTELPSENHIRIIELLPGANEDEIKCNLTIELRRHTQGPYDAISYVWGERKDVVEIICCDRSMRITKNLADALRTIRMENCAKPIRLWADAISIDQGNTQEKNHQVKRMGLVYGNARQVHIWLGLDEAGDAQATFNLIHAWIELLQEFKTPSKVTHWVTTSLLCQDSYRGLKLANLMRLPWFSRVWVAQEVALSQSALLHWGNATLDFADLVELSCFYDGGSNVTSLIGGDSPELRFMEILFRCVYRTYGKTASWAAEKPYYFQKQHPPESGLFLDILLIGKALQASETRDHVYAFLGNPLALNPEGQLMIEPDYDKPEDQVHLDLAEALLRSREGPFVLCFVQHDTAEEVTGSRGPSWVPKWSNGTTDTKPVFTIGNIGMEHAAGGAAENLSFRIQRPKVLVLQGMIFDELRWTSKPLKSENFALDSERWDDRLQAAHHPYIHILWEEASIAFQKCLGPAHKLNSARYDHDFSYTLVTGYNNRRLISREEHHKVFKAYRDVLKLKRNRHLGYEANSVSKRQRAAAHKFERQTRNCTDRRLAITKSGRFALVPRFAQAGDVCAIFAGMATPFVLRTALHGPCYHLVGEAYARSVMRGELAGILREEKMEIRLI
tara:strand:- start:304 stop:2160 length:1857 start_codon:yes stop_codon:yes gene_type:complete